MAYRKRQRVKRLGRADGMTLIEVTATLAVLAVTGVAIAKWVAMQSRLDRQTEIRLAASLSAQNAVERLRKSTYENLESSVADLKAGKNLPGLQFTLSPFDVDDGKGLHLRINRVDPKDATKILASEHLWRISLPKDKAASKDKPTDKDSSADKPSSPEKEESNASE